MRRFGRRTTRRRDGGLWRAERDRLFRAHPQSPIEEPAAFGGLPFFNYDPALRFMVGLRPAEGAAFPVAVGGDGEMRLRPFATTDGLAALGGGADAVLDRGVWRRGVPAVHRRHERTGELWRGALPAGHDQGGGSGRERAGGRCWILTFRITRRVLIRIGTCVRCRRRRTGCRRGWRRGRGRRAGPGRRGAGSRASSRSGRALRGGRCCGLVRRGSRSG